MIKFLLKAVSQDGELYKEIEWPVLPRIGEMITVEGNYEEVTHVFHDINGSPQFFIDVNVDVGELERLEKMPGWKTFSSFKKTTG